MKIATIIRQVPTPIYTGINLIVQNVLKRLSREYQLKIFVLDESNTSKLMDLPMDLQCYSKSGNHVNDSNNDCKIDRVTRYYRTEKNKLLWLQNKIDEYNPDRVLGFGYDLIGYFGLLNTEIPKILDIIDDEILFLWRDIKNSNFSLNRWKNLIASIIIAKKYIRKCSAIITVSQEDTNHIKRISNFHNVHTIPNGVDFIYYCPDESIKKVDGQIIFIGSMNWCPNRQAVNWFLKNCWDTILKNKSNATLIVIGKFLQNDFKQELETYKNVKAIGFVDDLRNYIRASEVSIAPMVSGSGIKNKILEAWALGQPVVATHLGAKGIFCKNEENILLANNSKLFSKQVIRLLSDKNLKDKIAKEGRKHVIMNYSWEKIGNEFNRLIENCNH
jgi:glycosyltransferase involved in cell wall biosynthesis